MQSSRLEDVFQAIFSEIITVIGKQTNAINSQTVAIDELRNEIEKVHETLKEVYIDD